MSLSLQTPGYVPPSSWFLVSDTALPSGGPDYLPWHVWDCVTHLVSDTTWSSGPPAMPSLRWDGYAELDLPPYANADVRSLLATWLTPGRIVVLLAGSRPSDDGPWCGWHGSLGRAAYALVPRPDLVPGGCLAGATNTQRLCHFVTHELREAQTDTPPGSGWVNEPQGDEDADERAWPAAAFQVGSYLYLVSRYLRSDGGTWAP